MGDHDGSKWYISRKEIEENSPSRRDGIDLKKETYFRKSYCTFLQELGMELKVPQLTIATAIVLCHRFYFHQSHAKNDRKTVATVCMFIAGKVEETPRLLKDVIVVSHSILHKKDSAAIQKIKQKEVYEEQKELILLGERLVLMTLGFDLNIIHPYKDLMEAIRKFKDPPKFLAKVAWNFVNDGLRTSLCLQFSPRHIAAGAIFLGAKFVKVKLLTEGERVWWQEFGIAPGQLEDVSNQLLELYEQTPVNATREGGTVNGDNWSGGGRSEVWDQSVGTEPSVRCSNSCMGNDEGKSVNMKESMEGSLTMVSDDARSYGHGAVEKKRKPGAVLAKKKEFMDDDDLMIQRELVESGVELGARKNHKLKHRAEG